MQADIPKSNEMCKEVYERLDGVSWARVTSERGTDITLELHPGIKWLNSDWDFKKKWHNIPSGEVFTAPSNANGEYVVDGVLGDHFDGKYGSLERTPVIYRVKGNHIVNIYCTNKQLEMELRHYVFGTHNGDILGSLV